VSASDRIRDLLNRTGGDTLKSTVTVDQVYAQYQHERLDLRHPRGGMAKYLEIPLFAKHPEWLQEFAGDLLDEGFRAVSGWGGVGRRLVTANRENAPLDFGDLRNSASLTVKEGASVVIDEPAPVGRLTEEQLRNKHRARRALSRGGYDA